ncbi:M15 family metallopeptidase [Cellulomonas sp. URHB0016]
MAPTGVAQAPVETARAASSRHRPPRRPEAPVRRAGLPSRLVVRLGVLGCLAGGTVVIPFISQGAFAGDGTASYDALADSTLPSTVSALTGASLSALPPASLVATDGALVDRGAVSASRDEERSILAGCDGSTRASGENGLLKVADLCTLWDGHTQLRADAAVSLAEFDQAFAARFGADLCLSSGYRTLAQQRAVKAQKGGLAAAPGKSNHGWGLAVDLCQDQTSGARWAWLNENGPTYGWQNPSWAKPGGSGPFEKWHWEYVKGVKEDGEYYDG